ncbi:enoyl-CoA hydratase/isomerase family protein [Myroides sp. M-43]|uniref:enoyl-CoA hydratase/isomerase family protein n=1 Tax=Myroides oncorhynchi TaxID=2893756 RepID=UPI001E2F45C9|nr:enoyl-CoA hydratase/isomerase family protein [Myroides oncorhynchi]MCC9043363.1 enoyl-CoA hydratase/isomerase family protein [Myroides oncorhynchi]
MSVIITDIRGSVGLITINSERSLNALSMEIVTQLKNTLVKWKDEDGVKCVFLQGAGEKAFCAGGDIREVRQAMEEQKKIDSSKVSPMCIEYFVTEYSLDYLIHTYSKPIVVWGDGIVMGGGLGLLAGASHRVVTERSLLAMPEISIGLYPDVGASYFLNKMPSAYGLYLGLTGTRFNCSDALFLGIADYCISSLKKQEVIDALLGMSDNGDISDNITSILNEVQLEDKEKPISQARNHQPFILELENINTVEDFVQIVEPLSKTNDWIAGGYSFFEKGSPTSTRVILKQLLDSRKYSLEEVFKSELNLTCQFTLHPDFSEGVRALLIDKDQSPKWSPSRLLEVTEDWVESHFSLLWDSSKHPFNTLKQ